MVKKRGIVWNYFNKKVDGAQVIAFCKFCDQSYIQNATRMERHMERCLKCPEDVRQQFIQAAHSKKNKISVATIKKNDNWPNQEPPIEQNNVTDTELEDLDEWGYRNEIYTDTASGNIQPNVQLVMQTENPQWVDRDTEIQNNQSNNNAGNRDWEGNRGATEAASSAGTQDRGSTINHERRGFASRRISPCSLVAVRSASHSSMQSKIYQEQLMERRAARRTAELELRRKTLELERFQWEFERDKAHSELKWAHETRMMQLKEERERQIIDQNRSRLSNNV